MLTLITATMLSMAAASADPVTVSRKQFRNCMIEAHNKGMTDKTPVADFKAVAEAACPDQRKAFYDLVVKGERQYSNLKDSQEYADEEVKMVVEAIEASYGDNFETKATLVLEP